MRLVCQPERGRAGRIPRKGVGRLREAGGKENGPPKPRRRSEAEQLLRRAWSLPLMLRRTGARFGAQLTCRTGVTDLRFACSLASGSGGVSPGGHCDGASPSGLRKRAGHRAAREVHQRQTSDPSPHSQMQTPSRSLRFFPHPRLPRFSFLEKSQIEVDSKSRQG